MPSIRPTRSAAVPEASTQRRPPSGAGVQVESERVLTLRQEIIAQPVPNVGVGYLEDRVYLGASFLVGWSL
jgi:hypothetical protein